MGIMEKIIKDFDEIKNLKQQISEHQAMLRMQEMELKDELINQRLFDLLNINYARLEQMTRRIK
jgi:hypothetical protein